MGGGGAIQNEKKNTCLVIQHTDLVSEDFRFVAKLFVVKLKALHLSILIILHKLREKGGEV